MEDDRNRPEQPRVEPEIIPPDRSGRYSPWSPHGFANARGTHRIYVTRMGPVIALLLLAIAAIATIFMIAVLGAVLIWIPIVAIVVIAGALLRLLRR
jgi:hypothetical protein